MSDELSEEELIKEIIKEKIWEHVAIRPDTFVEFRRLKKEYKFRTDDEFIIHLLDQFRLAAVSEAI